ncbi:hypothetical protein ID866_7486 [Astraeus odoratus]|nr:hypothetical protein ID866_7486 [Astraeus odoratus]
MAARPNTAGDITPSQSRTLHLSPSLPNFNSRSSSLAHVSAKVLASRRTLRQSSMARSSPASLDLQQHIYSSLLESRTADISLHVRGTWEAAYKLHRVVLIQSGFFNSLFTGGFLESSPRPGGAPSAQQDVNVVFDDLNITRAAFEVCLSRLYGGGPPLHVCPSLIPTLKQPLTPSFSSPATHVELPDGSHPASPRFLLSLLATAVYLSMPTMASQALTSILDTVGPYTVVQYLRFAIGIPIGPSDDKEPEAAAGLEKIATLISPSSSDHCTLTSHKASHAEPYDLLADELHELVVQKEDPAESDTESENDNQPRRSPSFIYGAVSDKIGEAAVCWLARWGPDMFAYEERASGRDFSVTPSVPPTSRRRAETMPSRSSSDEVPVSVPPRVPVIWARGGLTSKWIRELISSDALFVKGERERYDLARAVVEFRRRQGIDEDEEKDWQIMFQEGIYYANMLVDDIIAISQDISPSTGRPFVPMPVLQAALWNQSLLRHHIASKPSSSSLSPPHSPLLSDKELGICLTTADILSRCSISDQQSLPPDEKEKVYYPVTHDSSMRLGDGSGLEEASLDQLFEPSSSLSDSKAGPRVVNSEANFFGLKAERKTALECIASDATGKAQWSPYPPCRFAVEFWDIASLKEKSRLHSHTIWYAGSLFNVYVQVVRKKGIQLGLYLHRQSSVDRVPGASTHVRALHERTHNRVPSLPQPIPASVSSPTVHYSPSIHPPTRSPTPNSAPSTSHTPSTPYQTSSNSIPAIAPPVAPVQPYRDPRPSVSAYFAIFCGSPTGSSITLFTSVPDVFSVNQSWGWKSSSLRTDDLSDTGADGQPKPAGPAAKEYVWSAEWPWASSSCNINHPESYLRWPPCILDVQFAFAARVAMSKGKAKQTEPSALLPPLPNPPAGSANPSASLPALWGYILPALNHIVRSPTNNPEKAPAIDISYHMGIHTATYNYFTTLPHVLPAAHLPHGATASDRERQMATGTDLYLHLDKYFTDLARELLLGAPEDDAALIQYLVPCFKRYAVGAHSVNRLLNYVNRHYVKRAVDEDRGWLTLSDMFTAVAKSIQLGDTREQIAKKLKERRVEELRKWGYSDGGSAEQLAEAELRAEAASPLDRIVPLEALALRRFRTEFMEPLLTAPKMKGKKRRPGVPPATGPKAGLAKARLARAVQELLEVQEMDPGERRTLAGDLAALLRTVGVQNIHPLRKRLDKLLAADLP